MHTKSGKNILLIIISLFILVQNQHARSENKINYRQEMRDFVMLISKRAKQKKPGFFIITQNAMELITYNGKANGKIVQPYLSSIDGTGCEELLYGNIRDGIKNPAYTTQYFLDFLLLFKQHNKAALIIDYVTNKTQAKKSFQFSEKYGFISFQGHRSLSRIPNWIYNKNNNAVSELNYAKNFLYLLTTSQFHTPSSYISALKKSEYDLLIIDTFFWEKIISNRIVRLLQHKPSGKRRLVIAYLSIGEAEDYRYYWKDEWKKHPPDFLEKLNPEWEGNFKVKYWHEKWKEIICGRTDGTGFEASYLKKILDAGFDGVYLDIIDAAMYFEKKNK